MTPPNYESFEEKSEVFKENFKIDSEEEVDSIVSMYSSQEKDFLYRGINTATYKLYSSSQVQWMLSDAISKKTNIEDYYNFIIDSIELTRENDRVKQYIKDNGISDNDLFILAMMQHYGMPSPVLDFSHSIFGALYFAWDKCNRTLSDTQTQLSDYISLYVINKRIDWVNYSVQNVMRNSAEQLNDMLQKDKLFTAGMVDTKDVEKEFLKLPYSKFKDWNFVAVEDNPENPVKISIPALKFDCEYQIINDRIISQQGMFIANNTLDKPLVELMNDWCKEKYFVCYNIHKKLLDYIKQKYFDTNDINEERMYCTKDEESNYLEEAIRELNRLVKEKLSN